jgi:hypothetical protein
MIRGKDKKVFSIHWKSKEKEKEINYAKAKANRRKKIFNFKVFGCFCKFRRISVNIFVEKHSTASLADCHEMEEIWIYCVVASAGHEKTSSKKEKIFCAIFSRKSQ